MHNYDHKAIEQKWQQRWEEQGLYTVSDEAGGKEKLYALVEFPYPSGNLHIGHWYAFAVPDIYARAKRMQGFHVLFPFGFDSFGLPAENAAIKNKLDPKEWTYKNIDHMTTQLRSMGNSFDWSRKVVTSDPEYYKWTQWQFLQFFKSGLAYRATELANWCPSCNTVLANEQVRDGKCERCGSEIEKREQATWFLKITDYAERLLSGLDDLDWPEEIKDSQRNWIGKSEGAVLPFKLKSQGASDKEETLEVFTTRPDTLFGATYVVLAPEHALVHELRDSIVNSDEVEAYVKKAKATKDIERTAEGREKTGVRLEGVNAINPGTNEEIPVYIADYVLAHYGTGAIMAVPAHDERDHAFATKFSIPIRQVVRQVFGDPVKNAEERTAVSAFVYDRTNDRYLFIDNHEFQKVSRVYGGLEDGESHEDAAVREVLEETGYRTTFIRHVGGETEAHFYHPGKKVDRTLISRCVLLEITDDQPATVSPEERTKHEPIWLTLDEARERITDEAERAQLDQLTADTPYTGSGTLIYSGEYSGMESDSAKQAITEAVGGRMQATYRLRDWSLSRQRYWGAPIPIVYDPDGKPHAVPDEHLPWILPEDVDFTPTGEAPLARSEELKARTEAIFGKGWTPEIDTFDTFIDSSWYFLRYTDPHNDAVFADKTKLAEWLPIDRYSGGAEHTTMHVLYSRFWHKALHDLGLVPQDEPYRVRMNRGQILGPDGKKMSKSKGNVVDPDEHVERVGADTVRLYLAFMGPYNVPGNYPFDLGGVAGMRRFLERIVRLHEKVAMDAVYNDVDPSVIRLLHQTIRKVGEDCDAYKFNTAISQLMILVNLLEKQSTIASEHYATLLKLLAPFAPHLADELWEESGGEGSIHVSDWPKYDEALCIEDEVTYAIQINGKVRATLTVPRTAEQEGLEERARELPMVKKWLTSEPKRTFFVPNKIINFIIPAQRE